MTGRIEKTVFISYRHTNKYIALAIYQDLIAHGYKVFIDYEGINSGDFKQSIIDNIKSHAHFIVVLTPSALDRCHEPGDWLRREIETAMEYKRNIVPVMMEGFNFGDSSIEKHLIGKLEILKNYQGLDVPMNLTYFKYAMKDLRERYLNIELSAVSHPASFKAQRLFDEQNTIANKLSPVEQNELKAQEWFERGFVFYEDKKYSDAIRCYTEAIRLLPGYAGAYNNRGNIFILTNNLEDAIDDYTRAIELDPNYTTAYSNRGVAWTDKGNLDKAIYDLDKAIQLEPKYSNAYINLGMVYHKKGYFDKALENYDKGIKIDPKSASAYNKRGVTREKVNDIKGALKDFNFAVKYVYKEEEYLPYHNRGRVHQIKGDLEHALSDYNESILLNPKYPFNYFNRALIWEKKKDYLLARADLEKYLELSDEKENNIRMTAEEKIKQLTNKATRKKTKRRTKQ